MTDHNLFSIIPYKDQLIKLGNPITAYAYYRYHKIDLLTGASTPSHFTDWIITHQNQLMSSFQEKPRIIHLFYELGFLIENKLELLNHDVLLVIDITFTTFVEIPNKDVMAIELELIHQPTYALYRDAFEEGRAELIKGNCYQFNLTFPFTYLFKNKYEPEDFIFSLWKNVKKRGAYGSATYIPYFKKLFISNSPECLFQYKKNVLSSMPIKGTLLREKDEDLVILWDKLIKDKKNQAELFMITDLIRNDLSRIDLPRAVVVKKKFPKIVPGLLHQYSQIDVKLRDKVTLWQVIEKIFPGGSISGAPKRRAVILIKHLEKRERGFYCGSTLILNKEMKSASINIRSSVIDFNSSHLSFQAGGGITLLSNLEEEFDEMTYKRNSFISTLTI